MTNVHAVNINHNLSKSGIDYLLSFVSAEKQEIISKYHKKEDAKRALISDVLLRRIICSDLGIENKDIVFDRNEYGKPSLKDYPDYYFNISHSGDWVVCCTCNFPIGVDVEQIKPIDFTIAKRFFSTNEYKNLMNKNVQQRLPYFFELWTLKESYIKAIGKGLSIPLNSFTLRIDAGYITVCPAYKSYNYYFRQYSIDKDYKLAVCSGENEFYSEIKFAAIEDMIREIM